MKTHLFWAALAGGTGVALGAFGAHGLKSALESRNTLHVWETAVFYHLVHAAALVATTLHVANNPAEGRTWFARGSLAWMIGILLFSGSLYWLALGGPRWLGPVTPMGGAAYILGWIFLGVGAFKTSTPTRT